MFAFLPCPKELLPCDQKSQRKSRYTSDDASVTGIAYPDDYAGFWVATQDPAIIARAPGAIVGATEAVAREELERKLGAPPGFTYIDGPIAAACSTLCTYNSKRYQCRGEEKSPELRTHRDRLRKLIGALHGGKVDTYAGSWHVYPALAQPQGLPGLESWKYMAEAKNRKAEGGVLVPDDVFPLADNLSVNPVEPDFVVERCRLGLRLVYSPKRCRTLVSRRNSSGGRRGGYKFVMSPYDCLYSIVASIAEHLFDTVHIGNFANPNLHSIGIDSCTRSIQCMWPVVEALRHEPRLCKKLRPVLKAAYWHRDKFSHDMQVWLDAQLKRVGGPPAASTKRKYQKLVSPPDNKPMVKG